MDEKAVQEQLLEIYKLQAQLTNDISNRRTTTNRFYILVMSGLILLFTNVFRITNVLQNKEGDTPEILKIISGEQLVCAIGVIGLTLSMIWCVSLNSYLRVNSRKYEALKDLEMRLSYQFFKNEWSYLPENEQKQTYWQRSRIELILPIVFFLCFWGLMGFGLFHFNSILYHLFHIYPISLIIMLFCGLRAWLKIEKNFRKGDNTDGEMA